MICASVITYELSKRLGKAEATRLFNEQIASVVDVPGEKVCCQAVRVFRRLRKLAEVAALQDAGGTSIGFARSRAFSIALAGDVDIWISVDDDTEADTATLNHVLRSIDPSEPQIIIVPCLLRTDAVVNITLDPDAVLERVSPSGARLRRALYGGFGIVAMSRAAMQEMASTWSDLTYVDDDGATRFGLFCEYIRNGWWLREDYAFFSRVPRHVRVEALLTGQTDHGGKRLQLDQVEGFQMIPKPRGFEQRDTVRPPALVV
jgi:hypothetical protein